MKIAIIGPGALGCLLATHLCNKHEVWLLDHNQERAEFLDKHGLLLEKEGHFHKCPVKVSSDPESIDSNDLVLLCVKSHHLKQAVKSSRPAINKTELIIALQNGISHLQLLPDLLTDKHWGLGTTAMGATLQERGKVLHRGTGPTLIGFPPGSTWPLTDLKETAAAFSAAGIPTETTSDILKHLWDKLMVNTGINALTAIYDCPNGALLESAETMEIMADAVREARSVAERSGISFDHDPLLRTREVCKATSANISSMLQDVRAKRPTEINAINGAVVKEGDKLGMPVPVNRELLRKVKEIERNYNDFP